MKQASFFRRNTAAAIVALVFGIIGTVFLVIGGVFLGIQRRGGFYGALPALFPFIFLGIGGAFFLVALGLLLRTASENSKRRAVVARGNLVYATVTDVRQNRMVTVNGRSPYVVECRLEDGVGGETYLLKSDNLWNGRPAIEPGATVPVFWDEYDKKHYTVDVSGLTGKNVVDLR